MLQARRHPPGRLVVLRVVVLLVRLEQGHQVWQLEGELVGAELQLERRKRDEALLFGVVLLLVAVVVLGEGAGDHGAQSEQDKELLVHGEFVCLFVLLLSYLAKLEFVLFLS